MPGPEFEGSASSRQRESLQHTPAALPLRAGEQLTRREFERRYLANPNIKKAELVEGVTQVREPVGFYNHSRPHSSIAGLLFAYAAYTPGVSAVVEPTVRLDRNNEPQPDAALLIEAAAAVSLASIGTATLPAPRNWLWRSPRAALPATCSANSTPTGATACASTLFGARSIIASTGLNWPTANLSRSRLTQRDSFTAPCSRACAWRSLRCSTTKSPRHWKLLTKGLAAIPTRPLRLVLKIT